SVVYGSIYIRNSSNILVAQNVIGSVSGTAINFDGTSNSTITSNFIGTNPTGNIAIPNGGTYPLVQHGIYLNNNNTNLLINNNVISNNLGYGIFADGSGSNHRIQGNIIGLNQLGLQPFSNKVGGIYYHATSTFSNITIGGVGSGLRNIISGNGVTIAGFVDQQNANSTIALQFDATNACGIYLYSVVNSVIINNYIGTDINGNSTTFLNNNDLGNLYAGIKIENNSASNLILNNIVGGNGFRSSYYSGSPQSIRGYPVGVGHGILIKDNGTVNNQFRGNYIGLGANGLSPIGNRQDGFSIQGAKNNTIGGLNISDRNYSANNAWGIFIQSDFWRSQSSGNVIINNYLGTDVTGLLSVGNGTRSFDGDGGGIGVQHASYNNVIGIAQVNGGNVISGNRTGIHFKRNNPLTTNTLDNACAPGREPECRFNNSNNSISNN
ncbi:MAG: right-handed parallel beta-helix repeat-containing protein, partial [Cytophagales bacterium]|nr:right-handed parallel beta-helix repeat-containing protein [Cytophagales bacterium]